MKKRTIVLFNCQGSGKAISIIMTHFNARYRYLNPPMPQKAVLTTMVNNIYIRNPGVTVFYYIRCGFDVYVYEENVI